MEKVDPRYEAQEPKTVVVKADETATVEFENTLKKWVLRIVKRDSETGNIISYAGTAFQLAAIMFRNLPPMNTVFYLIQNIPLCSSMQGRI